MRLLIKILFLPVIAIMAIFTGFLTFLVALSSSILFLICLIFGFGGLIAVFSGEVAVGILGLFIAYLLSPCGLPLLAGSLITQLHELRYMLQERIYG